MDVRLSGVLTLGVLVRDVRVVHRRVVVLVLVGGAEMFEAPGHLIVVVGDVVMLVAVHQPPMVVFFPVPCRGATGHGSSSRLSLRRAALPVMHYPARERRNRWGGSPQGRVAVGLQYVAITVSSWERRRNLSSAPARIMPRL